MTRAERSPLQVDTAVQTAVVKRRGGKLSGFGKLCIVEVANAADHLPNQYLVSLAQNEPVIRLIREGSDLVMPPGLLDASSQLAQTILDAT